MSCSECSRLASVADELQAELDKARGQIEWHQAREEVWEATQSRLKAGLDKAQEGDACYRVEMEDALDMSNAEIARLWADNERLRAAMEPAP